MFTTIARIRNTVLALGIALSVTFTVIPAGSAQQSGAAYITRVSSLEPDQVGTLHPVGLAFSAALQSFYVVEAQSQGVAAAGTSEILSITPAAERRAPTTVSAIVEDPLNMVFDNANRRLLAFQPSSGQLLEIKENPGGRLAPAVGPQNAARLDVRDPKGMALDETSGTLFILDATGPQILRLELGSGASFSTGEWSVIDLRSAGLVVPRGIAFDATTGHLHVLDLHNQQLYELTQGGEVVATRDLAPFGLQSPQALVFAPSTDQTDDPAQLNLFLADQGPIATTSTSQTQTGSDVSPQSTGQIVELSLAAAASLPSGTTVLPTTLVHVIDTSKAVWNPSAPDPAGVDYWPLTGRLLISDSEVDEMSNYFTGKNVFSATLSGALVSTCSTTNSSRTGFSNEPNGLAINRNNNRIYVTDDDANKVHEISLGPDQQYCTADDGLTSVNIGSVYNIQDAEDVAYGHNSLYIAGGTDAEVYIIPLGADGVLGGGDDGPKSQFDTYRLGFTDLEGIGYNWDNNSLLIVSAGSTDKYLGETTTTGTLLNVYDLNYSGLTHREDVTYAPSSQNPAVKSIYVADRGTDNNTSSSENDGQVWELSVSIPNTPTPDPNITPTAFPTSGPLYASFASNGTVGGVSFADEDIVRFDGQGWSLFFDGSDVGAGNVDLVAFSVLDADSFLMAFSANATLSGLAVTPQDIVLFDATSLGPNTAGTFSIYFDGPDVGLADTTAEKIDAVSVLPDGRILISTRGNPVVTGVSSPRDEDILAFSPTSLGDSTAGTWAMYFDGSDVGLAETSSEDIDASDIVGADIYLSTTGTFSVNGVAGAGEDVFVCTPTSLGDVTECTYASALYFDGSGWSLGGNSLDALYVGTATPAPTPTPTNTSTPFTPTPTYTPINTPTPTDTFTPTATFTPTNTPDPNITPTDTPTSTPTPEPNGNAMLVSFAANGAVGGVAFADEDVLQFDGQNWSLFFDGSDVGAGSVDLFGISIVDADTFLMTFGANVTLPAGNGGTLAVTPQDIVQFDATSLGDTTAGTFSMYLNGIDVGLDTSSETIDALSALPDGRILISTTVDSAVPGVAGKDEDLLAFTPASLGDTTSGTWAMYFDGSDVGLSNLASEDLDAAEVVGTDLYLSTNADFAATDASGAGEDVFICTPTSLGDVTACNFAPSLFFDGSNWGLAGNSLDGLALGP